MVNFWEPGRSILGIFFTKPWTQKYPAVASLILCSTLSSSYSSLDPLCYDHQLTGLYLVRQLTINSLLILQYIQSITSTQTCKISSLTEVTLTHLVNASSLRRSTDVPTPFHRLATPEYFFPTHEQTNFQPATFSSFRIFDFHPFLHVFWVKYFPYKKK